MVAETVEIATIQPELAMLAKIDNPSFEWMVRELYRRQLALDQAQETIRSLEEIAHCDPLTGIANRRAFDIRITEALARSRRDGSSLSLVVIDVDNFKRRNDVYGHAIGDDCLRLLASVMTKHSREGDTVARFGGEEFALILPATTRTQAAWLTRRIARMLKAEPCVGGPLTFSAGVAQLRGDVLDTSHLLTTADAAMYQAKGSGKDKTIIGG